MAQNTNAKKSKKFGPAEQLRINRNKANRIARHKRSSVKASSRTRRRAVDRKATDWDAVNNIRAIKRAQEQEAQAKGSRTTKGIGVKGAFLLLAAASVLP